MYMYVPVSRFHGLSRPKWDEGIYIHPPRGAQHIQRVGFTYTTCIHIQGPSPYRGEEGTIYTCL